MKQLILTILFCILSSCAVSQTLTGKVLSVAFVDGVNVNEEIIKEGYGWLYRKYCKASFCDDWIQLEERARNARLGLWRDKEPVPPWDLRRGKRNTTYTKKPTGRYEASSGVYHGNIKSYAFHSPSCRHYNCKNCIKSFKTKEAAVYAGYRPCGNCR